MCKLCSEGKYLPSTGSTSILDCVECLKGQVSSEGAHLCNRCQMGEYKAGSNKCNKCPYGKYGATIGVDNIDLCENCPKGKYLDLMGQVSITNCKSCSTGKYSITEASTSNYSCILCDKGMFNSLEGYLNVKFVVMDIYQLN